MRRYPRTAILATLVLLLLGVWTPAQLKADTTDNPFFKPFDTPFETIPFDRIRDEHYMPAIREGIRLAQAEVDAIVKNPEAPDFQNTIAALDRNGAFLDRVLSAFSGVNGAHTSPEKQKLAREMSPLLSAHGDNISLNPGLFARVKAVYEQRDALKLTREERYLLENTYKGFVRGGALLNDEQKATLRQINQELSLASLKFSQNLLQETNGSCIVVDRQEDLEGLSEGLIAMAAEQARSMGLEGKWVFTTSRASCNPFLQYAQKRELRQKMFEAYTMRGDRDNEQDNKSVLQKVLVLKARRMKMLGYDTPAHFYLEDRMAKTPEAVNAFLMKLWKPALKRAGMEVQEMQAIIDQEGGGFKLAPWDWFYYAEKLRKAKYDIDEEELRPYFSLEQVKKGIFTLCGKLYGITFTPRRDIAVYHPDVQVYEVREKNGTHIGILYMDFHPRSTKNGGAWSGGFRGSWMENGKRVTPHSTIVCNFTAPTAQTPSLLSMDETSTFFHEFGHALHSLFNKAVYHSRSVPRDSVELPSQIMENWAFEPELLKVYAHHYQTGKVIPQGLVDKIGKSALFNQGFSTVEYLAASMLDQAWHQLPSAENVNVTQFENAFLQKIGLIPEILPRYRSTYFGHIIRGYPAGYYSYIWSGVLDRDAFQAFKETSLFNRKVAESFRRNILEKLGSDDAATLYRQFRGRDAGIEPLLKSRGLLEQ